MSRKLEGKIALITGAAAGIGRATTELFLAEGARVIATDRDLKGLDGLAAEKVQLDVTDAAAIAALAKKTGRLDVLFNCAGFVENGTILDNDDAQWEKSFEINVYAMARMIKAFLPAMMEGGGGSIINVASVAGSIKGIPNRCIYGASKAAVIGLTKSVAADFVTKGIRCNSLCPGTVDSPSLQQRLRDTGDYEAARKAFTARQPLGRIGNRRGNGQHRAVAGQRRFQLRHGPEFHPGRRHNHLDAHARTLRHSGGLTPAHASGAKTRAMQRLFLFARHVAFIALVVRAMMPAGWMPAAQGHDHLHGRGPPATTQKAPAEKSTHHDICPFSAAPHLASVPDAPQLTLPAFHAFAAAIDRDYAATVAARFSARHRRAPHP